MARKPRIHLSGYTQHVIQRGANRDACFFAEQDYLFYLTCLQQALSLRGCECHAFVLMTNHVHLLLTPREHGAIAAVMKDVAQRYTQYVNYEYRRTGSIWEGRYKASVLDTEKYLLRCYRYIELNPVRAGMVDKPSQYRWSSARWHGLGEVFVLGDSLSGASLGGVGGSRTSWGDGVRPVGSDPLCRLQPLIVDHELYLALGRTAEERQRVYRELFRVELDEDWVAAATEVFSQEKVLGDSRFAEQVRRAVAGV